MANHDEFQSVRYRALLAAIVAALPRARKIVVGKKTIELAPAEGQVLARLIGETQHFECMHSRILRGRLLVCRLMDGHSTKHKYIDVTPEPANSRGEVERHPLKPLS